MSNGIPSQKSISNILFNNKECIKWLISKKIIWRSRTCTICQKIMYLNEELFRYRHICLEKKKKISQCLIILFFRK